MLKPVLVVESKSIPNAPLDHSKCSRFVLLARQYQASVDVPVINDTKKKTNLIQKCCGCYENLFNMPDVQDPYTRVL